MEDSFLISSFYIRNFYLCFIFDLIADGEPSVAYRGTSEGTEPAAAPMQLIPLTTNGDDVSQSQNSHEEIDDEDSPKTKKQYAILNFL